ncbi:cell division protein FtsZ, partial [bacterium]|nr:cell division protein FtsZ [bacterium]
MAVPKKDGNLRIGFEEKVEQKARILVIGAGGAGSNAVDNMIASDLRGVEFVAVNTDAQALDASLANRKIQIGMDSTRGLGAGGNPERGREAAEENADEIADLFKGVDMAFIAAGMGGGTGTGSAPVIARMARDAGVLTVGIVTRPFMFEGPHRGKSAETGVQALKENVDTLIVIPNDKILAIIDEKTSFRDAFRKADQILYMGTKGISDIISKQGFINLDFADAKAVMTNAGEALMGIGNASGEGRAKVAAEEAITSPLLDSLSIEGAQSILVNVTGGDEMGLVEVQSAVDLITQRAGGNAEVFFGIVRDDTMEDEISVTVIATGFDKPEEKPKVQRMFGQNERVDEPSRRPHSTPLSAARGNGENGSNGHGPRNGNGTPKNGNGTPKNGNGVHEDEKKEFLPVDASDEDLTTDTLSPALDGVFS